MLIRTGTSLTLLSSSDNPLYFELIGPANFNEIESLISIGSICGRSVYSSVCVCAFSSHSFWIPSSLDVPPGVTQKEAHTGFRHSFPSSTVKSHFVHLRFNRFPPVGHFYFYFLSEKNPVYRDRTHVPTCQKVTRLPLSYRSERCIYYYQSFPKQALLVSVLLSVVY